MRPTARLVNETPIVLVLLIALAGLGLTSRGYWRTGLFVIALGCLGGAVLRLALPTRLAGLLAVRGRAVDVATLGGMGAAILLLAAVVPR